MEVRVYEIINNQPVMYCGYAEGDCDLESEQAIIKKLLKKARENKTSIHSIVIEYNEDGVAGTLSGTESR